MRRPAPPRREFPTAVELMFALATRQVHNEAIICIKSCAFTSTQKMPADLARTFTALADPTRLAILIRLIDGEATVNELAAPFDMSQPAVSRHIKVLERAGLILRRVEANRRPCRLAPGALDHVRDWLNGFPVARPQDAGGLDKVVAAMRRR